MTTFQERKIDNSQMIISRTTTTKRKDDCNASELTKFCLVSSSRDQINAQQLSGKNALVLMPN